MIIDLWLNIRNLVINILGKDGVVLLLICIAVILDWISGMTASFKNEIKFSSKKAKKGFYSKVGLFLSIFFGYVADAFVYECGAYIELPYINGLLISRVIAIYALVTELLSIIENLCNINNSVMPKFIIEMFKKIEREVNEDE